jgi:hypothetical protein
MKDMLERSRRDLRKAYAELRATEARDAKNADLWAALQLLPWVVGTGMFIAAIWVR